MTEYIAYYVVDSKNGVSTGLEMRDQLRGGLRRSMTMRSGSHFHRKPELETAQWLPRLPLQELVSFDQWNNPKSASEESLIAQIERDQRFPVQ